MRAFLFSLVAIFGFALAGVSSAQTGENPWSGVWVSGDREYEFRAEMTLDANASGDVTGFIRWTFVRSPNPLDRPRLGLSALEYVEGNWDVSSGAIRLAGIGKDDPHNIIGLDQYRLIVSDDGRQMVGITNDDGHWRGRIDLAR